MSRFGPKVLLGYVSGGGYSREALLEIIGEGLIEVPPGEGWDFTRASWDPWQVYRQVTSDVLGLTGSTGVEVELPALRIGARTRSSEVQQGTTRTFQSVTNLMLDIMVGHDSRIDEHAIALNLVANPGWMAVGSELLAYRTAAAIRNAICRYLRLPQQPFFSFASGGWMNVRLSSLGNTI